MLVGLGGVRGLRGGLGHLQSGPRSTLQHTAAASPPPPPGPGPGRGPRCPPAWCSVDMCRYTTLLRPVYGSVGCLSRDGDGGLGCTVLYTVHCTLCSAAAVLQCAAVHCRILYIVHRLINNTSPIIEKRRRNIKYLEEDILSTLISALLHLCKIPFY